MLIDTIISDILNAIPGNIRILFIVGVVFGAIRLWDWFTNRNNKVSREEYDALKEKLRKTEERLTNSQAYYPTELLELLALIGRLFNVAPPATLRDAIVLVLGKATEYEGMLLALTGSSNSFRKDALAKGWKSILQVIDVLMASYSKRKAIADLEGSEASAALQAADVQKRANKRLVDENAAQNETIETLVTRHAQLRNSLAQLMEEFENMDGKNPAAINLAHAKGELKGLLRKLEGTPTGSDTEKPKKVA